MRRVLNFLCETVQCVGTLDDAPGATGLLIVSGGNEIRIGAHRGMARLAARLAEAGIPVFRFDRRGVGDSAGENGGYASSGPDIAAAASAFRSACPQITRLAAFGNCDAATALALFHADAALDALILANPWVVETADDLPPPAAIRRHYRQRLTDPAAWQALLSGAIDFGKLRRGVASIARPRGATALAADVARALVTAPPTRIVLAAGDATAIAFADEWRGPTFADARARIALTSLASSSHSFAGAGDDERLYAEIVDAIGRLGGG